MTPTAPRALALLDLLPKVQVPLLMRTIFPLTSTVSQSDLIHPVPSTSLTGISTNGAVTELLFGVAGVPVKVITVMFPNPVTPNSMSRVCVNHSVNDWVWAEMGEKRRTRSSTKSTDLANPGRPKARFPPFSCAILLRFQRLL